MTTKKAPAGALLHPGSRGNYTVYVMPDVTIEDVLAPSFWVEHAKTFRAWPRSLVRVVACSGEWELQLRSADVAANGAVHMDQLWEWRAPAEKLPELPDRYRVELKENGWAVLAPGGILLREGIVRQIVACRIAMNHSHTSADVI